MIKYLLDASVVSQFYRPEAAYKQPAEYTRVQEILVTLVAQHANGEAVLFVPSFCICEVKNTLAKWHYRFNAFGGDEAYQEARKDFIEQVHNRKLFYSYDLNRYHNLNAELVFGVEHTTDTEFQKSGLASTVTRNEIEAALMTLDSRDRIYKHYLSAFDILIISMAIELGRMFPRVIHLMTGDRRLAMIAAKGLDKIKILSWWSLTRQGLPGRKS